VNRHQLKQRLNRQTTVRWATKYANEWLESHGYEPVTTQEAVSRAILTGTLHEKTVGYRSPTSSPAAWFGNAATREALCRISIKMLTGKEIIAEHLRKPHSHWGNVSIPEFRFTPVQNRLRCLRAVDAIEKKLHAIHTLTSSYHYHVEFVTVYGRYHAAPMHPNEKNSHNIHGELPQLIEMPMEIYESDMLAVWKILEARGYTCKSNSGNNHIYNVSIAGK
jgi:hypothetical protein